MALGTVVATFSANIAGRARVGSIHITNLFEIHHYLWEKALDDDQKHYELFPRYFHHFCNEFSPYHPPGFYLLNVIAMTVVCWQFKNAAKFKMTPIERSITTDFNSVVKLFIVRKLRLLYFLCSHWCNLIDFRQTQYSSVTSSRGSNKTFTPPLPASMTYQTVQGSNGIKTVTQKPRPLPYQHQRQPSPQPVVVRHVFTSGGQGIPVTMAVLPQPAAMSPEVSYFIRNQLLIRSLMDFIQTGGRRATGDRSIHSRSKTSAQRTASP